MAIPERDPVYTNTNTERSVYTRESNGTGWFVGIIVVLALLAIGYLVFSANSGPSTSSTTINNTPAVTAPADPAITPAPMTEAPAAPAVDAAPMTAPTTDAAPMTAPATEAPAAPAATPEAPAATPVVPTP